MLTAATTVPARSRTGALTDATPASRSSTLSIQPSADSASRRQHLAGRPDVERQQRCPRARSSAARGATAARRRTVGRRPRARTAARSRRCARAAGACTGAASSANAELLGRGTPERDELEAEAEPALCVAANQVVLLERDREPMRGRPRQLAVALQLGEVERAIGAAPAGSAPPCRARRRRLHCPYSGMLSHHLG